VLRVRFFFSEPSAAGGYIGSQPLSDENWRTQGTRKQ
jgi:hypothetical protein